MTGTLLAVAEILRLVDACATAYPVVREAPRLEAAYVAQSESGRQRFAVGVNEDRARGLPAESWTFEREVEAVAFVRRKLAEGRKVDAGLMQITGANWTAYGLTLGNLFDPGANICAGARILGEAYQLRRQARCVYNAGPRRPDCTTGYPERIEAVGPAVRAALANEAPAPAAIPAPPAPPAPRRALAAFQRVRPVPRSEIPASIEAPAGELPTRLVKGAE
ncbi:MAG: hypothetical protein EON48_09285 [Acetobacteraceae bacterium]|nr:MAG: hypothetical protein EON48_09285 [Acetobacteraceae bacterium]